MNILCIFNQFLFHLIQSTFFMLNRHLPADHSVGLNDVTSKYTVINVVGPKATELLSELCNSDMNFSPFTYKVGLFFRLSSSIILFFEFNYQIKCAFKLVDCKRRICFGCYGDGIHTYRRTWLLSLYTVGICAARLFNTNGCRKRLWRKRRWCTHATIHENRKVYSVLG